MKDKKESNSGEIDLILFFPLDMKLNIVQLFGQLEMNIFPQHFLMKLLRNFFLNEYKW
jgi:hypothetical protein